MATITLKGTEIHTSGRLPAVGEQAPDFRLVNSEMEDVSLGTYSGRKKLLSIVPSLDTPVCAASTKKFNDAAREKRDAVFLIISADLPFAMQRFCSAEGADNVVSLAMMRSKNFAEDYGVLIQDGPLAGITARAVLVLDENDRVMYAQLVPEIAQEPDYEAALALI